VSNDVRLPGLTVEQASLLLDVLDALTAAVLREHGEAIARLEPRDDEDPDDI